MILSILATALLHTRTYFARKRFHVHVKLRFLSNVFRVDSHVNKKLCHGEFGQLEKSLKLK